MKKCALLNDQQCPLFFPRYRQRASTLQRLRRQAHRLGAGDNVWIRYPANPDRATNTPVTIYHAGGATTVALDQTLNDAKWNLLGKFNLAPGSNHRVEIADRLANGDRVNGYVIADAVAIEPTSSFGNIARWTPTIPRADKYRVSAWWPQYPGATTAAHYRVTHAGGVTDVTLNQSKGTGSTPDSADGRVTLGTFDFVPGAGHKVELSDRADGIVIADFIRWDVVPTAEQTAKWQGTVTTVGNYRLMARWPNASDLAANARYTVTIPGGSSSMTMDQSQGGGTWHLLKTVTLAANDNWKVELSDQAAGPVAADAVVAVPVGTLDAFTWAPTLPSAGTYQVFVKWPALGTLSSDATYLVTHEGGTDTVTLSQMQGGGQWRYLGSWAFDPAHGPNVKLQASLLGEVSADAIRFVKQSASGGVSYVLSDQVGQPQKLVDQAGTIAWDRIATPFGETASMATGGSSDLALRFPGQQDDPTTGLAYNYFRDYDPSLGRYVQSDPIGLAAGPNTYAYVGGNPVTRVDPLGLAFFYPPKPRPEPDSCPVPDCEPIYSDINSLVNELKKRYYEIIADVRKLPPTGKMSVAGHQQQFRNKQRQLRNSLSEAEAMACLAYHPEAWNWATTPTPSPR